MNAAEVPEFVDVDAIELRFEVQCKGPREPIRMTFSPKVRSGSWINSSWFINNKLGRPLRIELQPPYVALLVHPVNGGTKGSMESITLPSVLHAGFDRDRYPSASKAKSDIEVWIDSGIALPGFLEIGFVDEITYFRYEHLH